MHDQMKMSDLAQEISVVFVSRDDSYDTLQRGKAQETADGEHEGDGGFLRLGHLENPHIVNRNGEDALQVAEEAEYSHVEV